MRYCATSRMQLNAICYSLETMVLYKSFAYILRNNSHMNQIHCDLCNLTVHFCARLNPHICYSAYGVYAIARPSVRRVYHRTRSQAGARIADRTAKNCNLGHAYFRGNYLCACSALPIQSRVSNLKSLAQVVLKICSIVCQKL